MKDKKKILFICPSPTVKGGVSTVVKGYLDSSLAKKYSISIISSHRDGNKPIKLLAALRSMISVGLHMIFKKVDIVHIHGSDVLSSLRKYFLFKMVEPFNCMVIYHFHGASFMDQYPLKSLWWKNRINYLFNKSDMVFCLSENWANQIKEIAPYANIQILKNAVKLPTEYHTHDVTNQEPVKLLFLGLIGDRKGIFDLLEVVHSMKNKGHDFRLFIGGIGEVEKLKNTISNLGLENNVYFLGWVEKFDTAELFKKCDLYVLPSYGEGMPMSILEAMSYGLPVISTNVGGIPELVKENVTGYLVQPGDLSNMAEKIETLITDSELRAQLGANARALIKNQFNLDNNINKLDQIYQNLMFAESHDDH